MLRHGTLGWQPELLLLELLLLELDDDEELEELLLLLLEEDEELELLLELDELPEEEELDELESDRLKDMRGTPTQPSTALLAKSLKKTEPERAPSAEYSGSHPQPSKNFSPDLRRTFPVGPRPPPLR